MDYGDADTPLARWLRQRIGNTKLREVQRQAARRGIRLGAGLLSTYLKDGIFPRPDVVKRLAEFFNVAVAEIEAMRPGASDAVDLPGQPIMVPLVQDLVASLGQGTGVADAYVSYYPAPHERGHEFVAFEVRGDCMEPIIHAGEIVIVDRDAAPGHGKIVLIDDPDEGQLVKELQRREGEWWAVPRHGEPIRTQLDRVKGVVRSAQRFISA